MLKLYGIGVAAAMLLGTAMPAHATLFDGCPSAPILEKFQEFGKTGRMPSDLGKWLSNVDAQYVEPWKPFDNVTYVGICWVSAWLIETDDGIVLIDTLYGPFADRLVETIESVGVDLSDIKYVLMTHGHFDHVGGAATLKPLLPNATFVMTQRGWEEAAKGAAASKSGLRAWDMIAPDRVIADGETIMLGDNRFTVLATPGHTWGTASYTYNVEDGNDTFRAVTVGGLGLNAIEGPEQVEAYIESVDRLNELVGSSGEGVEVHLSTHGFSNGLQEHRLVLAERKKGEPNVFVDASAVQDQLANLRAGAKERLEKERAQ